MFESMKRKADEFSGWNWCEAFIDNGIFLL